MSRVPSSAYSDIAAGDAMVRTIIERPTRDGAVGAVLVAWGFEGIDTPGTDELRNECSVELERANLACVTIEPRRGGREGTAGERVTAIVAEASAVLRWMLVQDDLDPARIGVCGVGAGAIIASVLAGRTDQLRGVCL
ncbi:MAG: hypothetical protein KJO43_11795, partial [Phycisphaerae bacterium]|nr:hypothetical protein [Phycisphaerae bacterium]